METNHYGTLGVDEKYDFCGSSVAIFFYRVLANFSDGYKKDCILVLN